MFCGALVEPFDSERTTARSSGLRPDDRETFDDAKLPARWVREIARSSTPHL